MEDQVTELTPRQKIEAWMQKEKCAITSEFVPWSKSRNYDADPKFLTMRRTLNWRVTVTRDGRPVLTTDYSAGIAHAPSYKFCNPSRLTISMDDALKAETETGKNHTALARGFVTTSFGVGKVMKPDAIDVIWSLSQGAGVIDYDSFETWAFDFGFDPDSRKAEAIYRACLDIALKLRAAFGEAGLASLNEAGQDY